MERLGGRAGLRSPPGVCERMLGESARCSSPSGPKLVSEGDVDMERKCDLDGMGIWLGVFARVRGKPDRPGVCDREGGR